MVASRNEYLTTKELADLLRIKERKVYELAASGEVPCSRATGKLLFPRQDVEAWVARNSSGLETGAVRRAPNVVLGSHDPLLDWALRESGAGLATFFDGSTDGLDRFARAEGIASGLHLFEPGENAWNIPAVRRRFGDDPVVLVEFAWRERGLICDPAQRTRLKELADVRGCRIVPRQCGSGSQVLLEHLLTRAGIGQADLVLTTPSRTETEAAVTVLEGKADVAFGLSGVAQQYRLAFLPLVRERFDLLVERRAWFEPPMQQFLRFCASPVFAQKAAEFGGYAIDDLAQVHFNGP